MSKLVRSSHVSEHLSYSCLVSCEHALNMISVIKLVYWIMGIIAATDRLGFATNSSLELPFNDAERPGEMGEM